LLALLLDGPYGGEKKADNTGPYFTEPELARTPAGHM